MFVIKRANKFLTVDGQWSFDGTFALSFNYACEAREWARGRNMDNAIIELR